MTSAKARAAGAAVLIAMACGRSVPSQPVAPTVGPPPVEVWLDVDPATGLPGGEVDDGLMMLQVFHSPELRVRGISVVFGNSRLDQGIGIAREITGRFGPPGIEPASGAASADELGVATDAVRALAAALAEAPMTVLAVGPVTNIGSLVRLHPELVDRIDRVVVVAGRRVGQSFRTGASSNLPHRDFNFELDPAAMQVLLDAEVPLELAPWEVSSHVWLHSRDLEDLRGRSEAGAWVADACESWLERWRENLGVDGFNPFDTLAAGWVSHPQRIESVEVGIWIEEREDDRQPGERKPYLLVDPQRHDLRRATYTYLPDPGFAELLKERLAGR